MMFLRTLWTVGMLGVAGGHRLDEYLQTAYLSVEPDRLEVTLRLAPGMAMAGALLQEMDTNGDGELSGSEQRAYAERVRRDVRLQLDGVGLMTEVSQVAFPPIAILREGTGEISLTLTAELPAHAGHHRLTLDNRHQTGVSAYRVECLEPHDGRVRFTKQTPGPDQSHYELDYDQI